MIAEEPVVPVVVEPRRRRFRLGIVEAIEPQAERGEADFGVDALQLHILEAARNLANPAALRIPQLLFAMLADAQAMDDLVLRSGDQILALLARMDLMILQRSGRSEEHTYELQSLMPYSYAVFCVKKKKDPT